MRGYMKVTAMGIMTLFMTVTGVQAVAAEEAVTTKVTTEEVVTAEVEIPTLHMKILKDGNILVEEQGEVMIYSNQPLWFEPVVTEEAAQLIRYEYAIVPNGEDEVEEWAEMERTGVQIDLPEGYYQLRFRSMIEEAGILESVQYRVCFDRTPPELALSSERELEVWQKEDIVCEVRAMDTMSGMADILCRLGKAVLLEQSGYDTNAGEPIVTAFTLSEETPAEGSIFEVSIQDRAGNGTIYYGTYYLDKTAPRIVLSGVADGQLLAEAGNMDIAVTEAIYEGAEVIIETTRLYEGTAQVVEGAAYPLTAHETGVNRRYDRDGIYTVSTYARDQAGNVSDTMRVVFRVDVTAPLISLHSPEADGLYCTEKELRIEIEEEFYQSNQVSISVRREVPGGSAAYVMEPWSNHAKKTSLTHTFREDGIYHVRVEAVDEAGHAAEAGNIRFLIDRNAPIVAISGIADYGIASGQPILKFQAKECFYDMEAVTIAGVRTDADAVASVVQLPQFQCDSELSELEYAVPLEGKYHIRMKANDAVGHTDEAELFFTYDCTPPQIGYLDTIDQTYQEQFLLPEDFRKYIKDLTGVTYRIYVNQEFFDENQTIREPGKYTLSVEAVDEAGNMAVKTAEFIIQREEIKEEQKTVSIQEQKMPLHDGTSKKNVSRASFAEEAENSMEQEKKITEEKNKKWIIKTCLICGVLATAAAGFGALRYVDRKKGT